MNNKILNIVEPGLISLIIAVVMVLKLYVLNTASYTLLFFVLFTLWIMVVFFLVRRYKYTTDELGLSKKFLFGWQAHLTFTLTGVLFAYLLAFLLDHQVSTSLSSNPHFQYRFVFTAVAQEFVFRSYMLNYLNTFYGKHKTIIIGSILFALAHVAFRDSQINIPLTLIAGLVWSYLFFKYRNLYLLIASHAILNFVFTMFGFITNS